MLALSNEKKLILPIFLKKHNVMSPFFTKTFKKTLIGLFFAFLIFSVKSQNLIDINAKGAKNLQAQISENIAVRNMFKEVDRYRQFDYNKQLANMTSKNTGDTLWLNFFDDKQYKSVIQKVAKNINGRTSITSKIVGTQFAYCYMVVSENTISISAQLPYEDECFFASVKSGQAYISQVKKSELDKTALEGTHAMVNLPNQKYQERKNEKNGKGIDDPVIIDLLIVYTPAAAQWALGNSSVTDIYDLIDIALQLSNTAVENSNTGITFHIVHIHLTDYVEDNTVEDLYRITDPWDGYMDEVHELRDQYYADEILFIPAVNFTGGVAWLLQDEDGFDPDYYAVALSRVQQTSWTYTAIHEIGHNMGAHHHWAQNFQAGPGLFWFSSGWRGVINGAKLCSVMTYEQGTYFSDGQNHTRIPYFSSPEIIVDGVVIGDLVKEDNTLTLKRTKTAVANYRTSPAPSLNVNPMSLNYGNVTIGTTSTPKTISVSGTNLIGEITYLKEGSDTASFEITQTSWSSATGGVLQVTLFPSEAKKYNTTITFSSPGIENKVVVLNGTGIITYNIIATAGANGKISPSGTIKVNQGESKTFNFTPNDGYIIEDVLINGISNQEAIVNHFYVFENIMNDQTIHVSFDFNNIDESNLDKVKIYSYSNYVFIHNESNELIKSVEIFDMMGKLIHQGQITKTTAAISLQVSNGIYCVRLISESHKITTKKVLLIK